MTDAGETAPGPWRSWAPRSFLRFASEAGGIRTTFVAADRLETLHTQNAKSTLAAEAARAWAAHDSDRLEGERLEDDVRRRVTEGWSAEVPGGPVRRETRGPEGSERLALLEFGGRRPEP